MCNLAGYVGTERAAPILIDLISRQEGWAGGYYTGLATVSDGRIHTRKVVGDLAELLRSTDAADLPGTTGIVHSRSKSGGDVEWGHPFTSPDNGLAYVANGHLGFFEKDLDIPALTRELKTAGYTFRSEQIEPVPSYPAVDTDRWIHFSELMCDLIDFRSRGCGDLLRGLRTAYQTLPGEIVGLCVSAQDSDAVYCARINQPLMVGVAEYGTYLSTTALAFPERMSWVTPFPVSSVGRVSYGRIDILPFDSSPGPVENIIPWSEIEAAVLECLGDRAEHGMGQLKNATVHLWRDDCVPQKDFAIYETLRKLDSQGRLTMGRQTRPGVLPGTDAPFFTARVASECTDGSPIT